MDSHRAAYWLDRPPAEAADFLARTAVASRRVGGFVKRAAGWQDALGQAMANPHLQNAAIGAGIGGLGGLGIGMLNRKKKNPLATALSGAAIGGLGAGAGSYALSQYPNLFGTSPEGQNADVIRRQNLADARTKATGLQKVMADVTDTDIEPPEPAGPDAPDPTDPLAQVKSQETWGGNLARAALGERPWTMGGVHLGLGGLQAAHNSRAGPARALTAYMTDPKNAPEFGRPDPRTGAVMPENTAAKLQPFHDELLRRRGDYFGLGRFFADEGAGQALQRGAVGRSPTGLFGRETPYTPHLTGVNLAPTELKTVINQGRAALPKPSLLGGAWGLGKTIAPHILMNALSRYLPTGDE
jgi:hypothetical protein